MTAYRFFNIEYELFSLTRPIVDQKLLKSRDAVCFICLHRHRLQQKLWVHSTFGEVTQASNKWASRNTSHPSWMQILINSGQLRCTIPTAITDKPPMNQTFPCLGFQVYPMIHWFGCEKLELEKLTKIRLYKSFIFPPLTAPQEVQPPVATSLPNSLLLSWNPPRKANGPITQYSLYMDGMLIYAGNGENCTVTGKTSLGVSQ